MRGTTDLRIRLTDLRRHPGERATVAGPVDLDGVSVTSAEVAPGTQGELHAVLESLSDGVTVSGTVEFSWTGDCRRCLEGTSGTAVADIHEVFKDRPDDPNGDLRPVDGDVVDLEPAVREAVILSLPLAPLCRDDCPGPAPDQFPVTTADPDAEPPADPRWAALAELDFDGPAESAP